MEELWSAIRPELVSFVATILGLAATWAINSLRRKIDHETAGEILDQVEKAANLVVRELEQSVVPEVKACLKEKLGVTDGKLSKAEAGKVKAMAVERVKAYVPKASAELIVSAIESAVLRHRAEALKLKAKVYGALDAE